MSKTPRTRAYAEQLMALTASLVSPFPWIGAWTAVHRQREVLRELDDRILKDIGITRAAADAEAARPFWDVPDDQKPSDTAPGNGRSAAPRAKVHPDQVATLGP